ncbi:ABC transporter substrate-binding protein [Leifsonia sp. Root112D2]|jgi:multiple sugar transport system substrate-binding protein|uniref:ABC transporter substrate-binding protein n=1 Tax=Leifsonia sp. Root112D2 TaxID=1736426 RepID=UPI0006F221A5|nr:extracellular solute-binding protein [Leifsonia sp. Root112D2]KQV06195.1 sugar ABC transporter substrate-binding protein [Leifsonia sp. Root112D2]
MAPQSTGAAFTRRSFIGVSAGAVATAVLAACSTGGGGGGGGGGKPLKFWNMPWGGTEFNPLDKKITVAYKPKSGLPSATYQEIQWANFTQTFSSAVASNTGPAVSSGGGTQAFQFANQGKIAYADDVLESWKKDGLYDDFLPGLIDAMKTDNGYAAVPYNLDVRISWYNKTLMQQAGVESPKSWDDYQNVCAALKKNGVYGFGLGSGAGSFTGSHILTAFMINNGGGLFNADKKPDCVTPENIEAMEFVLGLVKAGYSDPASATYTSDNVQAQWKAKKFGFGWDGAGLPAGAVGDVSGDLVVGDPLTSPSGKKGGLYFPNNIMMYKNTPSQKGSEAFLTYYYKNMAPLWTKNTGIGLPPLKSIADTSEFKANANNVKILSDWQPILKTWAAPGGDGLFYNIANTVDGTAPMLTFTQSILGGKTDAKSALTKLQTSIEGLMK